MSGDGHFIELSNELLSFVYPGDLAQLYLPRAVLFLKLRWLFRLFFIVSIARPDIINVMIVSAPFCVWFFFFFFPLLQRRLGRNGNSGPTTHGFKCVCVCSLEATNPRIVLLANPFGYIFIFFFSSFAMLATQETRDGVFVFTEPHYRCTQTRKYHISVLC
ncbi:hypothetical protein LY76DRAFT_40796 [Colletotrichum caudatum]|nr:hypothetical protein LY76DRAFT_40796 [Colletotrichum caudatum]